MVRSYLPLCFLFIIIVAGHAFFAKSVQDVKAEWLNVPPVPSESGMVAFGLGDRQFAYRFTGLMLQNLGNTGGHSLSLTQYDYDKVGDWLFLADKLDPQSNFVPLLASFYFSATLIDEDLTPVIDYLAMVGKRKDAQKWRWLAQAVYLARFRLGDMERALALAEDLAQHWHIGRPAWIKQMPALILSVQGEKEAAYDILMQTLREEGDHMDPTEVKFMVDHICQKLLTPAQAARHSLCEAGHGTIGGQ